MKVVGGQTSFQSQGFLFKVCAAFSLCFTFKQYNNNSFCLFTVSCKMDSLLSDYS